MTIKKFLSLWGPVFLWCGLIFALSSVPYLQSGLDQEWDMILRKGAHAFEYAMLAALFWRALQGGSSLSVRGLFFATFAFCVLYAISDEFHQGYVAGRTPAFHDCLLDSTSSFVMCFLQARWGTNLFARIFNRIQSS